ncbi:hypothetical protein BDW59DRAFT_165822 [Aspergillus cavernicola]|uniref:Uncharacterized protein n=1 Tax=Aspergillus cavernicola TaxID=176166 RepID=A0ABR4HQN2_9EURO
MLDITVTGTHREISLAVSQQAAAQVAGSIEFYHLLFKAFNVLEWTTVRERAAEFQPNLKAKFPRYHEEIEAISDCWEPLETKHDSPPCSQILKLSPVTVQLARFCRD